MKLKKKLFNFLAALIVVFGSMPFSFVANAYADEGSLPAPATNKNLIDNGDGTYTIALSVTGETDTSSSTTITKANVILVLDTSSSMNQAAGNTYYLVTSGTPGNPANEGNSRTTYYRKDGNAYRELYYNNGTWYATRTQGGPGGYNYSNPYTGDFYARSRLWAEKHALIDENGIIDNLLSQNVPGDANKSDIIEVALVNFGQKGITQQGFTTNSSVLKSKITSLATDSGTNWEEALIRADELADSIRSTQPNEDIYVLFLTDGQPSTANNDYTVSNGATGNTGWIARWGSASDNARDLVVDGDTFYGLFTWGDSDYEGYLKALVQYAYTGAGAYNTPLNSAYNDYYTNASSTETLIAALKQIVNDITTGVGYTNVELTDGVTAMTDSSVKTSTNGEVRGLRYYRSGGQYSTTANDGLGEEWADAPKATINNKGEVDWRLGDLVLENGVTYTVAFSVWPKQNSLDLVSDLNNGLIDYDELTSVQKAQIAGSDGNYTLKTNTDFPTVTYSTITTTTVNGQTTTVVSDPVTKNIDNPDPVDLYSGNLTVKKKWEDDLDSDQQNDYGGKVTLDLYKDNTIVETYELSKDNGWSSEKDYSIAPGVMVYSTSKAVQGEEYETLSFDGHEYVILEQGHRYYLDEQDITSHYYLTKYEYHPMIVNGVIKNVLFDYDNAGNITAIKDIESLNSLSATNTLKGGISILKEVHDKDGKNIDELDEVFKVRLSFKDSSYPYTYRIYYGNNNPCSKDGADAAKCNFDSTNPGRTNKMTGTGVLESDIYVGDEIMIIDVDTGTKFKVEEITDEMKSWYELSEIKHEIKRGANNYGSYKQSEIDGNYRAVQANSSSRATVINNYLAGDLKVSKAVEVESGNEAKAKSNEFEFDIKVYTDETKTEELSDYSKTVTLKNGESETITGIPAGTYYEITETSMQGFTTTSTGDKGDIIKNKLSEASFLNTYKVEPNSTQAKVAKMFGNYWDLTRINGFDFELTPKTTTTGSFPEITSANNTATQLTPASWTFKIVDEGTWTYEITEKEYDHPGVFPLTENEKVLLTVKATDNGDGTMTVEKTYNKNSTNVTEDNATIDNTYETQGTVSETINVAKTVIDMVTGNHNDKFTFELKDASGNVIDTISFTTSNLSGEGSFKTLNFDTAGTYRYTVSEKNEGKGGWSYDDTSYEVEIVVTEDYTTATLSSEMKINGKEVDTADFTNEYSVEPATAVVTATKDFKDYWYEGDSFTFTLESKDGSVKQIKTVNELNKTATFMLEYDTPGNYEYTITEDTQFTRPGISQVTTEPIVVKVSVVDNNNGALVATVTQGETETIENTYETKPTDATIKVRKTIDDVSDSKKDGRFTFDLKNADGDIEDTITISTHDLTGEGSFETLELSKEGTYNYTVNERKGNETGFSYDTTPRNVEIVVKDNKEEAQLYIETIKIDGVETNEIQIEIRNTYEAKKTSIELSATKEIRGRSWKDDDRFEFTLSGAGIAEQTIAATKGEKTVTFDAIEYTKIGTYSYIISETSDLPAGMQNTTGDIEVTVTVEDKAGELKATASYSVKNQTIVNEYTTQPTDTVIYVKKSIKDLSNSQKDGSFTFELKDSGGETVETIDVSTQELTGENSFAAIKFTKAGTYSYTVSEKKGSDAGFSYDTTAREVKIAVKDDTVSAKLYVDTIEIDGKKTDIAEIEVENTYKAKKTSIVLSATKAVEGRDWQDSDKFSFTLSGEGIEDQTIAATKDARTVKFDKIEYTKVGTYTYTISETGKMPAGMQNTTGDIVVTVNVTDDNGELKATAEYSIEDKTIVNTYSAAPVSVEFNIAKTIEDLSNSKKDATFRFVLNDKEYTIDTAELNGQSDTIKFVFDEEQTIEFDVYEIDDGQSGFTYDDTVYKVKIVVADDYEKAQLKATVTVDGKKVSNAYTFKFKNKYQASATKAQFGIQKIVEVIDEKNTVDEDFKFELANSEGKVIETIKITGEGEGEFAPIKFKKVGSYHYTIAEIIGSTKYYEYDPTIYEVDIDVVDKNGELTVESMVSKILGGEDDVEVMVFTNIYNKSKEEKLKTPNTGGRFTAQTESGDSSRITDNVLSAAITLFGILIALVGSKTLRSLIKTKRRDIIARNE
ncbi:hypothetical protein IKG06_03820 [Candidatus Saccharibacteria bacterium]|nr:hypothetical protein [Candidatus Saccharibacteria bacterium]